ncbi:Flp pilus assembly protein CpaB [Phenylobacterium sp.]|uniref:Flp pilus assembly protein CpaB n=1 Tax=Phenylobacterium sp. TaxID=1871053 RepID=UPI0035AF951E
MSVRTIASFAIAILLGVIAVVLVRGMLSAQKPAAVAESNVTPVVVAATAIARGAELKPAMLKVVNYPKAAVPAGAFQSVDQLAGKGVSRTALRPMDVNEPVLNAKLTGANGKFNLSGVLTPGMRAVSIRSDAVTAVGGFALPGDRVDILLTRTVKQGETETNLTEVLAENALVLAVDQTADTEADKPVVSKAVTVEVSPDQAQAIPLALSLGTVSLALRQISDDAVLPRKTFTVADLSGTVPRAEPGRRVRAKAAARPQAIEVRVTRGVETTGYQLAGR